MERRPEECVLPARRRELAQPVGGLKRQARVAAAGDGRGPEERRLGRRSRIDDRREPLGRGVGARSARHAHHREHPTDAGQRAVPDQGRPQGGLAAGAGGGAAIEEERGPRELGRERAELGEPPGEPPGEREARVRPPEPDQRERARDSRRALEARLTQQPLGEGELPLGAPKPGEVARPCVQIPDAGRLRTRRHHLGPPHGVLTPQEPPRECHLQQGERGERRGIARIPRLLRATEHERRGARVPLGDVQPCQVLQRRHERGVKREDCLERRCSLAARAPDEGSPMQQLVAQAKLAEQEILPAPAQRLERVETRAQRQALGPNQRPVVDREIRHVGAIARRIPRIVLQVEPAPHLGMSPVADPARRVERGGRSVGGASLAPAAPGEGALGAEQREPTVGGLRQHEQRQRGVEQLRRPVQHRGDRVGETVDQGGPLRREPPGSEIPDPRDCTRQVHPGAPGIVLDLHPHDEPARPTGPELLKPRRTPRRELRIGTQPVRQPTGDRVSEPGWQVWRGLRSLEREVERRGRDRPQQQAQGREAQGDGDRVALIGPDPGAPEPVPKVAGLRPAVLRIELQRAGEHPHHAAGDP